MPLTIKRTNITSIAANSVLFDGTSQYLSIANNAAFNLTGDFTIECWFYYTSTPPASSGYDYLWGLGGNNINGLGLYIQGGVPKIWNGSSILSTSATILGTTWYHIVVVKNSSTLTVYLNGTSIGSVAFSSNLSGGGVSGFNIARWINAADGEQFPGYISNLRIVNGTALYTASFTPPTAPLTAIANTSLLTCNAPTIVDSSTNNFTITNNGSATVSSINPFRAPINNFQFVNRNNNATVLPGTQRAIFGYGNNGATRYSITNLVSNTGVVASNTTGVGTSRHGPAAAGYGIDKAIFGYGYTTVSVSMTNLVSNTGVVSTDTTGVGTARQYLAAAGYGTDKAIFGYGSSNVTNLVSNTGVVATDTTGVGTSRSALAAAGYGSDKAIFGYGTTGTVTAVTNLVSNTGVVATDTTGVGTSRSDLAAAGYGSDKAIFGYGGISSVNTYSITNLVSNTGVVATDTTGVGTTRLVLAAAGYGSDKAIFGYGQTTVALSMTNLVSNTGVVATDTAGVGAARNGLAAAGFSLTTIPAPSGMSLKKVFADPATLVTSGLVLNLDASNASSYPGSGTSWFDLSGNGNTGTLTNGPTFNSANGGSIVFDGSNDYVSSFPTQISGVGSKTVSAWIKINKTSRTGVAGTRSDQDGWAFTVNRGAYGNLTYFHTGGSEIQVAAGIITNTWYNVCVTYNLTSTTAILYLNGVQIGSPSTSFTAITPSSFKGVVGNEDSAFSTPFGGNIAQTLIYNTSLSASEVLQNYNVTKAKFGL